MNAFDVTIERLGIHGEGVASQEGYTVFVDEALPGERVRVRWDERRKTYGRAHIVKSLTSSPHRTTPPCPHFSKCGGCQLMHLEYQEQLSAKQQRVIDAFERIGKFKSISVLPCEPSPQPLGYRNKIQLPVDAKKRLGLFARHTHDIVEIDHCYIHCELGEKVFQHIQQLVKIFPFKERLRHVLIKTALYTNQVLVILVTEEETPLTGLAQAIMSGVSAVKGVVQNINPAEGNVILSGDYRLLTGQGYVEEKLMGLIFKVSPSSFFQVNPLQAQKLYEKVLDFSHLTGRETVLDAYCGVGTLSLLLARQAQAVVGVESVSEAITDAEYNALQNKILNARFVCAQTEEFMSSLSLIDLAVLNPPRKGCQSRVLDCLIQLAPKQIIYVSCDPATLARDIKSLCERGYEIEAIQPFDMFPQTAHVETIVKLSSKAI